MFSSRCFEMSLFRFNVCRSLCPSKTIYTCFVAQFIRIHFCQLFIACGCILSNKWHRETFKWYYEKFHLVKNKTNFAILKTVLKIFSRLWPSVSYFEQWVLLFGFFKDSQLFKKVVSGNYSCCCFRFFTEFRYVRFLKNITSKVLFLFFGYRFVLCSLTKSQIICRVIELIIVEIFKAFLNWRFITSILS